MKHRKRKPKPEQIDFLKIAEEQSPEMTEVVAEIRRDRAAGLLPDQPWRWDQCHSWLDGWLYIFRRVYRAYDHFMIWEGKTVRRLVQIGPDFNDQAVGWLERLAARLGPGTDMEELRLIGTRISADGLARLQPLFPNAKIQTYAYEDWEKDPNLGYIRP